MRTDDRPSMRRLDNLRCAAMAIGALTTLVGSFWMAGILF